MSPLHFLAMKCVGKVRCGLGRSMVLGSSKQMVRCDQAGHALVGALMPEYDPVTKISIVPRGAAGGLTFFAPSEERLESGLYSRTYLENQMAVALGGRVAEELIFGEDNVTTGASGDFQQACCRPQTPTHPPICWRRSVLDGGSLCVCFFVVPLFFWVLLGRFRLLTLLGFLHVIAASSSRFPLLHMCV